ncbi:hypothetical protein ACSBR1_032060 [Camellia fascicularis]
MDSGTGMEDYESLISTTDAELLKRAWRTENRSTCSPRSTAGHLRFCRTKRSLRALQLDNSGEEDPMDLDPNDVYAVQYNSIKPLVYSRQIGLV